MTYIFKLQNLRIGSEMKRTPFNMNTENILNRKEFRIIYKYCLYTKQIWYIWLHVFVVLACYWLLGNSHWASVG